MAESVPAVSGRAGCVGLTLIELLIGLAALSILLAGSWPGFAEALERRRTVALSEQMLALLQQARLEAQSRNQALRVAVHPREGGPACLLLHTGPAQACACEPAELPCRAGADRVLQVDAPSAPGSRLSANVPSMRFDPSLGTTTPAGRVVLHTRVGEVHHVVSVTGRVRRCVVPTSEGARLPGLAPC